jgi:hypothetical protein
MKTVLVICEAGYWRDLRDGLSIAGVGFLGFDKKKPNRNEIDQLVTQADFVVIKNLNVAHHSVRFAKEAAKLTNTPFWIGSNFGVGTILTKLSNAFPEETFKARPLSVKAKEKRIVPPPKRSVQTFVPAEKEKVKLPAKKKNLALKAALEEVKINDDDVNFAKLFKP